MTNLSSDLYLPLGVLLVVYAGLAVAASLAERRGDRERAEGLRGGAVVSSLVAAAYTLVLLLAAAASYPDRLFDALTIMVVVIAFFVVLLVAFFVVFELLGRVVRHARPGRR